MSLPVALIAAVIGYMLIWLAVDQTQSYVMLLGIAGGVLFGGGVAAGLFGR
jgi:hypothetical protein